jgi:altronate hydrolase
VAEMSNPSSAVVQLHPSDPVVVALRDFAPGEAVGIGSVQTQGPIPKGHKIAVAPLRKNQPVLKFGQVIGVATRDIAPGEHVHTHNLAFQPSTSDHAIGSGRSNLPRIPEDETATFEGIVRQDGSVATRNYVGVLTTVNCSATVARMIADQVRRQGLADFANVDGVVALTHKTGCGMASGEPLQLLRRTLAGYARHPNFSHVIVLGLGCEVNQIGELLREHKLTDRIRNMDIQSMGGTRKTVEAGMAFVREVLAEANAARRETAAAAELKVALQCGGSDGYSGVSANPALGVASDLVVRHGGTVILSETTETYGAEHLFTRRAVSAEVGQKLVDLMRWWEDYTRKQGAEINANPSPGNKAGGLTTILEKSLGAMAKAGSTNLVEVLRYAEPVTAKGFVFMDTPGYDPVSATGQVAGGANVVCFTTGRGSVFGCKPVPSIKIATNSRLYERMEEDMDVNCGTILDGGETVQAAGQRIFELILRVASGERTKSELSDFGAAEFAPWPLGATV